MRSLVLLATLLGTVTAIANESIELGPAPISNGGYVGRLSSVGCSTTDPLLYYVGAADGGVWKTIDGGLTWTPLNDRMPTQAIGAIAVDPTNHDIVYAGTGEANYANHSRYGLGIYKTTDGGDTWEQLAEDVFGGRTFAKLIIDPSNTQILYAAVGRAGGFPELAAARNHPGANGPVGVFKSVDAGVTWTQLEGGLPTTLAGTDIAIDQNNSNVLYACIGRIFGDPSNGIYKSTDAGATWTRLEHENLPRTWNAQGRISVAVAPSDSNRVYAMITSRSSITGGNASMRGAYRSDDAGATWTRLNLENIQATYGWFLSIILVGQTDPDLVFFGGLTLHRSQDGGDSFTNVTPPHVDLHALAWDANGRLCVGDDGGFHRTANLGNGWRTRNDGLGTIQFYAGMSTHPDDPEIVFGGTQDNGSNVRDSGGIAWRQVLGGDGGWTQINQADPSFAYCEFQGTANIYRSTNGIGGFNISNLGINRGDRNCFLPPFVIDPGNPQRMLYGTHRVFESTNGGANWTRIAPDLTKGEGAIRCLAIAPSDGNYVYAVTNDGNVQVSTNGGDDFELVKDDQTGWPRTTRELAIDPSDPRTIYLGTATFGTTQIQRSTDAGQTWEALDENFPDLPVNTVAVDSRSALAVLYAGTDQGLFRSVDAGQTWHRYGRELPYATIIDLIHEPDRDRMIVGTQGRGAWDVAASYPGDVDLDGDVDLGDLAILLSVLPCKDDNCSVDVNGDDATDLDDLQRLLIDFGRD